MCGFDTGHWDVKCESIEEMPYGFIYIITNKDDGRKYIGKKQCRARRKRPPLKGKKRNRWVDVELPWREYTSSSNEVNEDILKLGKEHFIFEIVRWCENKSQLAYFEAKEQFDNDVLLTEDYYNGMINLRLGRVKCN